MRRPTVKLLALIVTCLLSGEVAKAQGITTLQSGVPIERTLASGESNSFKINLEPDQFLQLVV